MTELSTNSGLTLFHLLDSQQSITKLPWQLSYTAKEIVFQKNQFSRFIPYDGICRIFLGTSFSGFPHLMSLALFSHVMKYKIEWQSNGKKALKLWERYDHQFPRFTPCDWFCSIFLYYAKLMGKPMRFSFAKVYHRMGILWGKITHTMGKVWVPIYRVLPKRWVFLHFPVLLEIDGRIHSFPIWWDWLISSCGWF